MVDLLFPNKNIKPVLISVKSMLLDFHPCTIDFIKNVCKANCCRSSNSLMVSLTKAEQIALHEINIPIKDSMIDNKKSCICLTKDNLCRLHSLEKKPIGCQLSPFKLTIKGTLIVRNRYLNFKCYRVKSGKQPAYLAHRNSLITMFGKAEAQRIAYNVINGAFVNFKAYMLKDVYEVMLNNEKIRRIAKNHVNA